MFNLHYRQTKRKYHPEGPQHVEGEITILDPRLSPGGYLRCDTSVPDTDEFKTVGNWRDVMRLAIKRQTEKRGFFTTEGIGEQLPSAERLAKRAGDFIRVLTDLLKETPDDDVEYCESQEMFVIDYYGDNDLEDNDG